MDTTFEVRGQWWLPERPERRITGVLRFDDKTGAELNLDGLLRTLDEELQESPDGSVVTITTPPKSDGAYPLIHGEDSSTNYSLTSCHTVEAKTIFPSLKGEERIRVNAVLKGALFDGVPIDAEAVIVGLEYLIHWMNLRGFEEESSLNVGVDGNKYETRTIHITQRAPELTTLTTGVEVAIAHGIGYDGDAVTRRSLLQNYTFRARSKDLLDLQDLMDIASDFQDLISIGTGRIAEYRLVSFLRSDVRQLSLAATDHGELPLQYYAQWNVRGNWSGLRV